MHFETIALIGQPISLADLRSHLRIDPPDEPSARDSAISAMLAAAVQLAQGYTGTALCAQRLRVFSPLAAGWQRLCLPFKAASIDAAQLLQGDAWLVQDPASFSLLPLGAGVAIQWQGAASLPTATALELELSTPVQALDDATRHALLLIVANLERNAGDEEGFDPLTPAVRQLLQARKQDWSAA